MDPKLHRSLGKVLESLGIGTGEEMAQRGGGSFYDMSAEELEELLLEKEDELMDLEHREPDDPDSEEYEEWDLLCQVLEEVVALINKRLEELCNHE